MRIDHVAIWTENLERLKSFYEKYFAAHSGEKYINPTTGFESYFLSFSTGARLELMYKSSIPPSLNNPLQQATGIIHLAISVRGENEVDRLAARLNLDGYPVLNGPRW